MIFQSRDVHTSARIRPHLLNTLADHTRLAHCHLAAFVHYRVHLSWGTERVPNRPGAQAGQGPQGTESVCVEGTIP